MAFEEIFFFFFSLHRSLIYSDRSTTSGYKRAPICSENVTVENGVVQYGKVGVRYRETERIEGASIASQRQHAAGMLNVSELISTTVEFRWWLSEWLARFSADQKRPRLR